MNAPLPLAATVRPHTVLIVDDSPGARYSLARVLRAAGFATVETAGGAQALELAARGVDAVVLDVHLPDLHGFEVCRLLRSQPATATLPVIHVSAVHVKPQDQVAGLRTGADAYLVNPVEPNVLVATLEALIRARALEQELRRGQARFRSLFERADCALALVDGDGTFVEVNHAFASLLGQPAEQLRGRRVSALAPARSVLQVEEVVAGWRHGWRGEFPLRAPDGAVLQLAWSVAPHAEPGFSVAVATAAPTSP
jgi:PAS domain S-box-containing protein